MLRKKPQAAAVAGLVVLGFVVGAILGILDVRKPWTYVVLVMLSAAAVTFMMLRFHR